MTGKEFVSPKEADDLFQKVTKIIEEARASTVQAVYVNMDTAYWFIVREIVNQEKSGPLRRAGLLWEGVD